MNIETFAKSLIGKIVVRGLGTVMESRFRYHFFNPHKILESVECLHGKTVLEIGCGTGFFTIPAAQLIGEKGLLVAMDVLPAAVEAVSQKVQAAEIKNTIVVKKNALDTGFDPESFDMVLLFGEIPAPMLPLNRLLPEMHRVLKPMGALAVWPPVSGRLTQSILNSGLFDFASKHNGVLSFCRCKLR